MNIGVLKESVPEKRVALSPENVKVLTGYNNQVYIEKGAGQEAFFSDSDYKDAGAIIVDKKILLKEAEILLKVNPLTNDELKSINKDQIVIAALQPFENKSLVDKLKSFNITSFSLELVPRITRAQSMDILSSMATITGYKAVLDAAISLPKFFPMFMSAAGTIKPAKVLILGAGVAGLQSIAIARKLGAVVEVFDVRSEVKEEVKSLGGKFIEVEGAVEDEAAGGYAVEQTEEFKKKQGELIHDHVIKSNVIICTAQIPGKKAPVLIRKDTVELMKEGSVIIDLAASTGGNCELTKNGERIRHKSVTIVGNSNYPAEMASDASTMFGRNLTNFLKLLVNDEGKLNLNFEDEVIKGTCLTHQGEIINERVKQIYS